MADGEFFIITCGCGEPGCAGLSTGLRVTHGEGVVEWEIAEPGEPRRFSFEARTYRAVVEAAISEARKTLLDLRAQFKEAELAPYGDEGMFAGDDAAG